ncbi:uncharacterized protein A1O9_05779 [Exophiala aquamarina CBS 119918]|uniref:Uncharacterized protein n=1 Tax=Exophiala aquamarina CBS 119918 TaxID=1182545 RepID=A0A072PF30_9EURO|nr:uncharacterized protein A1O9_05779 [Exophiala aquamarina CBS 119918]KEF57858.1 hypothetical protein A1O9_05779 [Exophiala aquamarina CBS 119918]
MSRRIFGWVLVVGFGIANGYITFQPAFEERERGKLKQEELAATDLGPHMVEIPAQLMQPATNTSLNASKQDGNK